MNYLFLVVMSALKEVTCYTLKEWRKWLSKNYRKEDRVLLIRYKKHTGKESFNQRDAMNEAICFGWIDTTLKRIDDERYGVTFVKRKKSSRWSENTFARAREMIRKRKMTKFGLKMYQEGLKKPTHDVGVPKNPGVPEELKKELEKKKNKKAKDNFEKLAPSYKRIYLRWLVSAKREETLKNRVKVVIERLREGKKWGD